MSRVRPRVSILIPAFNSARTIGPLLDRIADVASPHDWAHEVIVVNDGSRDGTWHALIEATRRHPALTAVDLARNCGQHSALFCALTLARGDVVVMLDDDLQHQPEWIPSLVARLDAGHDAVFAHFPAVRHPWWRTPGSALVRWTDRHIFKAPSWLFVSSFRAIRREVADRMLERSSPTPYVRGLILSSSRAPSNVDVPHSARLDSRSGYTPTRLASLAGRIVFAWAPGWVRVATAIALAVAAASMAGLFIAWAVNARPAWRAGFLWSAGLSILPVVGALLVEWTHCRRRPTFRPSWVIREIAGRPLQPRGCTRAVRAEQPSVVAGDDDLRVKPLDPPAPRP